MWSADASRYRNPVSILQVEFIGTHDYRSENWPRPTGNTSTPSKTLTKLNTGLCLSKQLNSITFQIPDKMIDELIYVKTLLGMWQVWVRRGGRIGSWWGNRRKIDQWGDLGVDGWIILGWISRRWDVGMGTGLGWPRTGTVGGRL